MLPRQPLGPAAAVALLALVALLPPGTSIASPALKRAAAAYAQGRLKEVVEIVPGARRDLPEAKLLRARALLELGRFAEARQMLVGLTRKLPRLKDLIRFLEARALEGQGAYRAAARAYRQAARSKPSRWVDESWRRRADVLRLAKRHRAAIKEYEHLLRIYPDHPRRADLELDLAGCLYAARLRRKAVARAREVLYRWPTSDAALRARKILPRWLAQTRFKLPVQPFDRELRLVRALRRGKRYDLALAEIERVRKRQLRPTQRVALHLEVMRIGYKRDRPRAVVAEFRRRFDRATPPRAARRLTADALARLGRVDEAVELLEGRLPSSLGMTAGPTKIRPDEGRITRVLREHGRFREVMERMHRLVKDLPPRKKKWGQRFLLNRYWAAYRAGEYDLAIKGLKRLAKRKPHERPYALYWQARAHWKAGRSSEAIALYQQVMERYLRTYYGLQARSRLVELGKLKLSSASTCKSPVPHGQGPVPGEDVPELITRVLKRYGKLYPSLRRARRLWQLGMLRDARRELRLVAIDFAWIQARLRPKWYILRPEVERIWLGTQAPKRRRWTRRAREVYKNRAKIEPLLGALLDKAGIFYYGWRYRPAHSDPVKHRHPRAYIHLVPKVAKKFNLDPNLLWAVMKTESAFRTDAYSRAGAMGLMQVMPVTARRIAKAMGKQRFDPHRLFEPAVNLEMAGWYLRALSSKFRGQLMLMAAAYNGGPHNVARWLDQRGRVSEQDEFIEEIPFAQSRRYAKKILRLVALYEVIYCSRDDRVASNLLDVRYSAHPNY